MALSGFVPLDRPDRHAKGIPFYAEEIIRALIDSGTTVHDESDLQKFASGM